MASVDIVKKDESEPEAKKFKSDVDDSKANGKGIHSVLQNLSNFELKRVLNNNTKTKMICLEGSFSTHEGTALVLLAKKAFDGNNLKKGFFNDETSLNQLFNNDVYGSYECFPAVEHNGINTTVIHPASAKHIAKYERQLVHMVEETPEIYKKVTLPHLEKKQFSLEWVYNILDHKAEQERVIFDDSDPINGFMIVPDLKWDLSIETLYVLAIVRQHGIKSIRDLNASHLPLLRNIRDAGTAAIIAKYGGPPASQLRIYFHYQPSFYHLHIHFTYLQHDAPGTFTEKAHLLSTVINNIELMGDYYTKATLSFAIKETDDHYTKYLEYIKTSKNT